jgi:hypothetical protein
MMTPEPVYFCAHFYTANMMEHNEEKLYLIQCTLSALVPIAIFDLQKQGGPSEWHFEQCHAFSWKLGAEGDTLLYRVKGKTGKIMGEFCEVVAALAFVPGGISVFGLHFEAKVEDAQK